MAGSLVNQMKFSIDDAFEENYDDVIRLYGSTTERSPLKTKEKDIEVNDNVTVWVETPSHHKFHAPADDNTSKDSDSLIRYGGYSSEYDYDPSEPCWKHPKIKENWKMVLAASALLVIGICLFSIGIVLATVSGIQALVFFIAGFICFIPGAYHVVYIYFAVKGKRVAVTPESWRSPFMDFTTFLGLIYFTLRNLMLYLNVISNIIRGSLVILQKVEAFLAPGTFVEFYFFLWNFVTLSLELCLPNLMKMKDGTKLHFGLFLFSPIATPALLGIIFFYASFALSIEYSLPAKVCAFTAATSVKLQNNAKGHHLVFRFTE